MLRSERTGCVSILIYIRFALRHYASYIIYLIFDLMILVLGLSTSEDKHLE